MSDYISREAAIEKIRVAAGCAECDGNSSVLCSCNFCDVYNAIRLIKSLPAADVEPVRHGRWVNMGGFPACSECACSPAVWEPKPNNPKGFPEWCYGCGAKMDLEDEEEAKF